MLLFASSVAASSDEHAVPSQPEQAPRNSVPNKAARPELRFSEMCRFASPFRVPKFEPLMRSSLTTRRSRTGAQMKQGKSCGFAFIALHRTKLRPARNIEMNPIGNRKGHPFAAPVGKTKG